MSFVILARHPFEYVQIHIGSPLMGNDGTMKTLCGGHLPAREI
jgi:hypothetical protein